MVKYNYYRSLEKRGTAEDSDRDREIYMRQAEESTTADGGGDILPCQPDKKDADDDRPLAMASVPFQYFRELYAPDEALSHGTLFRELDFPIESIGGCKA